MEIHANGATHLWKKLSFKALLIWAAILFVIVYSIVLLSSGAKSDPSAEKEAARIACNQNIASKAPMNGITDWSGDSSTEQDVLDATDIVKTGVGASKVWQVRGTMPAGSAPWKSGEVLYQCNVHITQSGEISEVRDAQIFS